MCANNIYLTSNIFLGGKKNGFEGPFPVSCQRLVGRHPARSEPVDQHAVAGQSAVAGQGPVPERVVPHFHPGVRWLQAILGRFLASLQRAIAAADTHPAEHQHSRAAGGDVDEDRGPRWSARTLLPWHCGAQPQSNRPAAQLHR